MDAPLAIGGSRLRWTDLPLSIQDEIESGAGAPVTAAISQPGGFSPGLASILRLADGRSVFVKAVSAGRNPHTPDMHRREAEVLAGLPAAVPTPRLLWSYDDGDWVALMTEAVPGAPPAQPWQPAELSQFLDLAARLAQALDPAPLPAPTMRERFLDSFTGWRQLAATSGGADTLDPWARRHLTRLAEIEARWPEAAAGTSLLHADLRADNVLLARAPTGSADRDRAATGWVVDWPHACVGAGWIDVLAAVPSIAMHGGGEPEEIWRRYPPGRAADPEAVTAVLAALTGFFLWQARQPPVRYLERVRAFQRAQGESGLAWLRHRLTS